MLEILLVIGIIAILAGIVIVAINPSKQLATVRNTERKSDLKQLYNAITQYYIDNSAYPSTISTTTLNEVCNTGAVSNTSTSTSGANCATAGLANLSILVPTYLTAIPTDPTGTSSLLAFIPTAYAATTATGTGYKVGVNTAKQVLISAPLAELGVRVVVGNVPTTVAVAPLNISGLVAHYKMNDTNGTTAVDSKGGYTGTGTYTANPSGKINGALSFNGTSDSVSVTSNANLRNIQSFSAWVKFNDIGTDQYSFGHRDDTNGGEWWIVRGSTNQLILYTMDSSYEWAPTIFMSSAPANTWIHITWVRTAAHSVAVYVNGDYVTTNTGKFYQGTGYGVLPLYMGSAWAGSSLNGSIDDVRLYSKALSSTEITQLYSGTAGTEAE